MKKQILYGDDREDKRTELKARAESLGYSIDLVESPEDFISRARGNNYDVLVSDLDYSPEGSEGYMLMKKLEHNPSLRIIYTGRAGFEHIAEGFSSGADHVVLNKDLGELVEILEKQLKGGEE